MNDFSIEVGSVSSRRYEEFLGMITDPPPVEDCRGIASAPVCRAIGDEAILALPTGRRASRWSLNSDANHGIQARASRKSLNGEFSGSRCDRIFLNAAVWSEDVQRPARRGNGSPYSTLAGQLVSAHMSCLRCDVPPMPALPMSQPWNASPRSPWFAFDRRLVDHSGLSGAGVRLTTMIPCFND